MRLTFICQLCGHLLTTLEVNGHDCRPIHVQVAETADLEDDERDKRILARYDPGVNPFKDKD